MNTRHEKNILDICSRRTLEYLPDCLGRFNRGAKNVILRTFGGSLAKGVRIAQILSDTFETLEVAPIQMLPCQIRGIQDALLEIPLQYKKNKDAPVHKHARSSVNDMASLLVDENGFVRFPIYHLLLDAIL